MHNVIFGHVRVTTVAAEKPHVLLVLCVSVSIAFVIQHATRMRCNMSSLARLSLPYLSTLTHQRHDCGGRGLGSY
jgi:hypothetical protein